MARPNKRRLVNIEKNLPKLLAKASTRLGAKGPAVGALQDYLLKYGFLVPQRALPQPPLRRRADVAQPDVLLGAYCDLAEHASSSLQYALDVPKGTFDALTATALKEMQRFHGLKPTAILDEPTLRLLGQARYDHHPDIPLYSVAAAWDHTDLTYQFLSPPSKLPDAQARDVIRRAFRSWQGASRLTFREVGPGQGADIKIRWAKKDHGDGYPFDGPWGILAHGFFPPGRSDCPGDLHFDDDEKWLDNATCSQDRKEADLLTVAAHEIGHCLGLDHSRDQDALMYSYYRGPRRASGDTSLAQVADDDIQGIKALYA